MSFNGLVKEGDNYTKEYVEWLQSEVSRLERDSRVYMRAIEIYEKEFNRQSRYDHDYLPYEDEGRDR